MQPWLWLRWENKKYYIFLVCVYIALGTQHEMRMRHILICGLSGSTIYLHIIS